MEFRTQVIPGKMPFSFSYETPIVLMGSCFAENIGEKLTDHFFQVDINPFGILYNPASVASGLRILLDRRLFQASDLFAHGGAYHSFAHHSRFSASTEEECLHLINDRLTFSSATLRQAKRLVVTFGTAWVYRLKTDGSIVGNCHKLPDNLFTRTRLRVRDIVDEWRFVIDELKWMNPDLKILFTVSPVRHWKDGAHGNQLSKATLLLAVDELCSLFPDTVAYFPAYEMLMDDLRDYRFYADDMLHPSSLAIDYIWNSFCSSCLTEECRSLMKEIADIKRALDHRPFHAGSEPYQRFMRQTYNKANKLHGQVRTDAFDSVIKELQDRLNRNDIEL